jgi:DNA-directed RNA polymerase specialized sigma24 family protein
VAATNRTWAALEALTFAQDKELLVYTKGLLRRSGRHGREITVDDEKLSEGDQRAFTTADDIVQEAKMRVLEGRRNWDGPTPFLVWMKGICRSVASKGIQRRERPVHGNAWQRSACVRGFAPEWADSCGRTGRSKRTRRISIERRGA